MPALSSSFADVDSVSTPPFFGRKANWEEIQRIKLAHQDRE